MEKSLREIQNEIAEWSRKNFGDNVSARTGQWLYSDCALLGIVEEVGELAHVNLKSHQGIRGYDDPKKYKEERDDAISDILVYLCDYAFREGVDLQECLNKVWAKVQKRDWEKNKKDAAEIVGDTARSETITESNTETGKDIKDIAQKLLAFKTFVHERLDKMGVPKEFPNGPHTKEGCRIGDRLDYVENVMIVGKSVKEIVDTNLERIKEYIHKSQPLDGKFHGRVFRNRDNKEEEVFVVFVPRDRFLVETLEHYRTLCHNGGADEEQVAAVMRLIERVEAWQAANKDKVKTPDAEPGECL